MEGRKAGSGVICKQRIKNKMPRLFILHTSKRKPCSIDFHKRPSGGIKAFLGMNNSKGINIHVHKPLNKSALPFLFFIIYSCFTEIINIKLSHVASGDMSMIDENDLNERENNTNTWCYLGITNHCCPRGEGSMEWTASLWARTLLRENTGSLLTGVRE